MQLLLQWSFGMDDINKLQIAVNFRFLLDETLSETKVMITIAAKEKAL